MNLGDAGPAGGQAVGPQLEWSLHILGLTTVHMSVLHFPVKGNSPWASTLKGQNAGLNVGVTDRTVLEK